MIRIWYHPERRRVEISGHAGYAPRGQDIVCAGASTLFYTLVHALREADVQKFHISESGDNQMIMVECASMQANPVAVDAIYSTIAQGFAMLANNYPEYVEYTEVRNASSFS